MRQWVRRVHRWCGLALVSLLGVSALSGSIIAFEHELDAWLNPELFIAHGAGKVLDADRLIARIEAADARLRVTQLPLDGRAGQAIELRVEPRLAPETSAEVLGFDRLFVDPVSGKVLGPRKWGAWRFDRAHLLPLVNRLHRTLTLPGRWGYWIYGGMALGWLGLSLMGLYLSLPAWGAGRARIESSSGSTAAAPKVSRSFWQRWKPAWQIKRGARGLRLAYDAHRAVGLWTLPLGIALAFTGVYLSLGDEVFKPVVAWMSAVTAHPLRTLPRVPVDEGRPRLKAGEALARARALLPAEAAGFEPWYLGHLPQQAVYRVAFREPGFRARALRVRYEQIYLDDRTGALRGRYGYAGSSAGDRFLVWQYPVHSGKVLGWPGRAVVAFGGLLIAALCVAGATQWGLRTRALRRRGGPSTIR